MNSSGHGTRTRVRPGAISIALAGMALLATACVTPAPGPGDPVPGLHVTISPSAATDTVTFEITTTNLAATEVRVWPYGLDGGEYHLLTSPPWTIEVDTSGRPAGRYQSIVSATDGTTSVGVPFAFDVLDCNGHRVLCGRTFDEVSYATTHNAMANANEGWNGPNQTLTMIEQLDSGVRALMIDTYRAGDDSALGIQVPEAPPDTPYLCHAFCALGEVPAVDALTDIGTWLDANPGEVVTLIIETYLSTELTAQAVADAGLLDDVYVPAGGGWPTLGALVDADTRLVVMQDRGVDPDHPWLLNVWDEAFETDFSNTVPSDFTCDRNRGSASNSLFILNHFLTEIFGSTELADQVNHNPGLLERAIECGAANDRLANFVTVDFVEIGDTLATVDALNGVAAT